MTPLELELVFHLCMRKTKNQKYYIACPKRTVLPRMPSASARARTHMLRLHGISLLPPHSLSRTQQQQQQHCNSWPLWVFEPLSAHSKYVHRQSSLDILRERFSISFSLLVSTSIFRCFPSDDSFRIKCGNWCLCLLRCLATIDHRSK